jgi:threonine/homoserine/homoserine lactone efflux protein
MGDAIGDMLPAAVGVAISPLPIIAVVLILATPRGRVNGPAFLVGSILGMAAAGTAVLLIAGGVGADDESGPAAWVSWLKLALGVLVLALAVQQWRARPRRDEEPATPKWMAALESFTAPKAAGAGVVVSGLNPKNLVLVVAGAVAIAQTGIPAGEQAVALAVFTLIGSIGVATPLVISLVLGERSAGLLERLKTWMIANSSVIMAVLLLLIGAKLVGDAIGGLSSGGE